MPHTHAAAPNGGAEPAGRDRRVLPINPDVRALLGLFLSLYRNYEEAAQAVSVSKDTIAKYFEGNPNIAYYVFERMLGVLRERLPADQIEEVIPETTVEEICALANERNGQQIDNVMYDISQPLLRLIRHYTEQFPSRAKAAKRLEINPRTFKAYIKGDIRSFPRRKFERLVETLDERGITRKQMIEVAGVASWEDLLSAKVRLETLNLSEKDLLDELKKCFEAGDLKNRSIDKKLRNAANRLFGNLGSAIRAAIKEVETESLARIEFDIEKANFAGAFKEIRRLERFIQLYAAKERAITRSASAGAKRRWKDEVLAMSQRKNKHKSLVFKALRLTSPPEEDRLPANEEDLALYNPESYYQVGEVLLHPEYGLGHVLRVVEDRQCVITFGPKMGEKTLVMNQRRGGPEFWNRP